MLRFLRETWFPTAVFAVLSGLYATMDRDKGVIRSGAVIPAVILVPLLWKSFVIRQGRPRVPRAALAGSVSAFLIMWLEWMIDGVHRFMLGEHGEEGLAALLLIFLPI